MIKTYAITLDNEGFPLLEPHLFGQVCKLEDVQALIASAEQLADEVVWLRGQVDRLKPETPKQCSKNFYTMPWRQLS